MVIETTIDGAGRVVIPQSFRQKLHLLPGTRLRIVEHGQGVILEPVPSEPVLIVRDGVQLMGGSLEGEPVGYREAREEWLGDLTAKLGGKARRRKRK